MGCKECGKPKCNGECGCKSPKVLQINNPAEYITFHKVSIPAAMGDSTTNPPKIGAYRNALVYYEADHTSWMYSTDGIPTKLTNGLTDYNEAVNLPQINGHTLIGDQSSSDLGLQGELTAGANVQINGNVISATDTTYTAGNGIELDGTEIKAKIGDGLEFDNDGEINIADIEQYAHFFNTVADMKAADLSDGDFAITAGYYTVNDGGDGLFSIRNKAASDVIDDNKIVGIGENLVGELVNFSKIDTKLGINLRLDNQNISDVKARIDCYKYMGVTDLVIVIHLDGVNCTVRENINLVNEAIAYAASKHINIDTVKFHCTDDALKTSSSYRELYKTHCVELLDSLEGVTISRVIILNELNSLFNSFATQEQADICTAMIAYFKSLGYEVSISVSALEHFLDCYYSYPAVTDAFDFIAINEYPIIGDDKNLTSEHEIKEVYNEFYALAKTIKSYYPSKDFIISEIGVQNVWESLSRPSNYLIEAMEGVTNSQGKIIPLFFGGLINDNRMNELFSEIWLWYSEYYPDYLKETIIFRDKFVGGNN